MLHPHAPFTNLPKRISRLGMIALFGYRFLKFFAIEGAYTDLGTFDDSVSGAEIDAEADVASVFAVGVIPAGRRVSVFAKAGPSAASGKRTTSKTPRTSSSARSASTSTSDPWSRAHGSAPRGRTPPGRPKCGTASSAFRGSANAVREAL